MRKTLYKFVTILLGFNAEKLDREIKKKEVLFLGKNKAIMKRFEPSSKAQISGAHLKNAIYSIYEGQHEMFVKLSALELYTISAFKEIGRAFRLYIKLVFFLVVVTLLVVIGKYLIDIIYFVANNWSSVTVSEKIGYIKDVLLVLFSGAFVYVLKSFKSKK